MAVTVTDEKILTGIITSPGICIGKAYIVDTEGVEIIKKYAIKKEGVQDEIKRLKTAVKAAKDELRAVLLETRGSDNTSDSRLTILETHQALIKDKKLYGRTIKTIEKEQINAEWALKRVEGYLKAKFQMMSDEYLKERATDIGQVVDRIMRNLVGINSVDISAINKRVILVTHELSPSDSIQINIERIKGVITDQGGEASHAAIIAGALGIPVVMGLKDATKQIKNDDVIIVDGTSGTVVIYPSEQTLVDFGERKSMYERRQIEIVKECHDTAETKDGFSIKIMGNIELPEEVVSVIDHGGEGIGLFRTEFQYLSRPRFPDEDELFEKYKEVIEVMAPRPVTFRTLDINGDKIIAPNSYLNEQNPALGLRGIRYCLKKRGVFKTQLRAILRAAAFGSVRILFPMISSLNEIIEAKKILYRAADSLEKEKIANGKDIRIGIMVEVPSAVIMADAMADEVDFFSIGTNDLIQYTLAIDRGNREVAHLFNSRDPAVIRLLHEVSRVAGEKRKKIFLCGEMAADPLNMPILLGLGFDELSMNPRSIPPVKSMIRVLDLVDSQQFLKKVLKKKTAGEISRLVYDTYGSIVTEKLYYR